MNLDERTPPRNPLVTRLYRSTSKKVDNSIHLDPMISHTAAINKHNTDLFDQKQPTKYLVPKITKFTSNINKLKPIQTDRHLQHRRIILHPHKIGRNITTQHHIKTTQQIEGNESFVGLSRMKNKMYSMLQESIILEQERKKDQDSNKKHLTPQDFMEILKIDREMSDQFCYMNCRDNAYDWQIVEFEKRNIRQYMVISKRGLTKYLQNQVYFIKFEQFLEEQKLYNRLNQIDYFRLYKRWKYFQIWHKFTSNNIFRQRRTLFEEQTLLSDLYIKQIIGEVKQNCRFIESIQTFYTQTISAMKLNDFKLYVQNERAKVIEKINKVMHEILEIIIQKSTISMQIFMKKARINKDTKINNNLDKKIPLLIGDESGIQMPYTQSATLRTHQLRIRNLLKLCDYYIIDGKIQLLINMLINLTTSIKEINQFYQLQKKTFGALSWISIEINQCQGELIFTPNQQEFIQAFQDIIVNIVSQICKQHYQFLHQKEFQQYWKCRIETQRTDQFIELKNIINMSNQFNEHITLFKQSIETSLSNLHNFIIILQPSLIYLKYIRSLDNYNFANENVEFFKQIMWKCKKSIQQIQQIPNQNDVGIILVCIGSYKQLIIRKSQELNLRIHQTIPQVLLVRAESILISIKNNYQKINENPLSIKQYVEFLKNVKEVHRFIDDNNQIIADNNYLLSLSVSYSIKVSENIKNLISDSNGQMIGLSRRLNEIEKSSQDYSDRFKKEIEKTIPNFNQAIKVHHQKQIEANLLSNTNDLKGKLDLIEHLSQSLERIIKDKNELQHYQQQLGYERSQFNEIDQYETNFKYIRMLWLQKQKWQQFYINNIQKPLIIIDFQHVNKYLQQLGKKINIFIRQINHNEVVEQFKIKYQQFIPYFKSAQALMSDCLEQKHLKQIRNLLLNNFHKRNFPSIVIQFNNLFNHMNNSLYNLELFQKLEINKISEEIIKISIQAVKQAELIQIISKVELIWRNLTIRTNNYKQNKQGFILGNNDELIGRIDDNLLIVNNVLASKYVGSIRSRVEIQAKMLRYVQDLIDEWYLHQKNWIYLQPILKSPFALKNLPKQSSLFNQIDSKWKIIMKLAKESNNIKKWADQYNSQYTIKILKNNNQTFEIVQKTLQNFLQKKRDIFQRFYFLSNDQLLEILSTVKQYKQIQIHLRKVFDNFISITFDDKDIPNSMISLEGEIISLRNCIFRGQVQQWFKNAQESMKYTLKSLIRQSITRYSESGMKRTKWIQLFPSQITLLVDSIMWTSITQSYLEDLESNDIAQWYQTNLTQLNQLVELINSNTIDLLYRKTLIALITQNVHFRDIIQSLENCQSIDDFKWIQQLRFYSQSEQIYAKQVQCQLNYGYEYLGVSNRLVITPLTDRCWITITSALHVKLGANPTGPAGTGKTQSCKDLSKSLGRYCIVFNCSDQINVNMMQKLFIGLCYTGSWSCLDQFNRINIEVLSVISQQIHTIRLVLLMGKYHRQLFIAGKQIVLNHDLGIFITMNPGYSGRTQLPDNLKILFRPISMMVPDYTLIAEIMLFSQGFKNAKQLSKKMTKLYKLSSEQLSQQNHYDFGMRAVKSVLVMAGTLKRQQPQISQEIILIKAMKQANIPKFLSYDIPLFNSILNDLFPSINIPNKSQQKLIKQLIQKCHKLNLIPTHNFIKKNIQFKLTLNVRFGVMLVGPPMSSKSSIIETFLPQKPIVINPKAVTLSELYGKFDTLTQTWTDGLASHILRQLTNTNSNQYILFDGPVDPLWVENLNTVLDDSMMLCLANGQRIKLHSEMKILFQVLDLNQASPATVSRCGMLWIDNDVVSCEDLISSFFIKNPIISQSDKLNYLSNLVKNSFKKGYPIIKKFCKEMVKVNEPTLIHSYCKLIKNVMCMLNQNSLLAQTWKKSIDKLCVYAYVWSIGSVISQQSKSRLDKSLSDLFPTDSLKSPIIKFTLSFKQKLQGQWISWNSLLPEFNYVKEQKIIFSELYVPTKQTYCYSSLSRLMLNNQDPIFLTANTGSGKTSMLKELLKETKQAYLIFTFTANTTAEITQLQLQSKLQTQRKMGSISLIPPPGLQFIYFIDDVNMPTIEPYGAQPPIELIRLILGYKGIWDRKTHIFKKIQKLEILIAGTYGRNQLPLRFIRFFNILYLPDLQEQSLILIFSEIIKGYFRNENINNSTLELIQNNSIVCSTLNLYFMFKRQLLPTPEKSYYLFNLRDVSKVIQGLTIAKISSLVTPEILVKLWVHQFQRVFVDRLNNVKDYQFAKNQISKKVVVSMKSSLTQASLYENPIIFCNFMNRGEENHSYEQVKDLNKLIKIIKDYMTEQTNMNLILFNNAIYHLIRISHSMLFQKGHIVLIGITGSGKKSLIKLSSILSDSKLIELEITKNYNELEFHQNLYEIMKKAAFLNKKVCFLFPQQHMINKIFLEDINNLLNSGEIPGMLTKQNLQEIIQQNGNYKKFIELILMNLHVCLTLSPIAIEFRNKIRNYPSLINCCMIDYIQQWPQQALKNVAEIKLNQPKSISQVCVQVHQIIQNLIQQYYRITRRKIYVTAKNYIEFIETFNYLLQQKKIKLQSTILKLSNGVYKLQQSAKLIINLQQKLTELQPILTMNTIKQQTLLKKLEIDRIEASQIKIIVENEQRIISEKTQHAMEEKKQADKILNQALPALQNANEALNTLNRNDISEIKMNQKPHQQVKFTLQCVSILLQQKQDWQSVRRTISDINFISKLKNLDVYHVPIKVQNHIKSKLSTNNSFKPYEIKQINYAAKSLCEWVLAVVNFIEINKEIIKKKDIVKQLNNELEISKKQLQIKRLQLQSIIDQLKKLEQNYFQGKEQKEKLDQEIQLTNKRIINAQELTQGLKKQRIRWGEYLVELQAEKHYIVGDIFLSTCMVVYAGALIGTFRKKFIEDVKQCLTKVQIQYSHNFELSHVLGDELQIANWVSYGLPKDNVSIDSAIIVEKTMKNPMMIDPQLQANKWIKNLYSKKIVQINLTEQNILKKLQLCLQSQNIILIEMVTLTIEPLLNNLLIKNYEQKNNNNKCMVKLGDKKIEIDKELKIYLFSKLSNPKFESSIFINLCVINFIVTAEGLQQQLLTVVVEFQLPEIQQKKKELIQIIFNGKLILHRNQDNILNLLNNSQGNILDDNELIENLKQSRKINQKIKQSLEQNEIKSKQIQNARNVYQIISYRATIIYLIISELNLIQNMYEFSLQYYLIIFMRILKNCQKNQSISIRIKLLLNQLLFEMYNNISYALFNQHKLIFAFLIACKIDSISQKEYKYFLYNTTIFTNLKEQNNKAIKMKFIPNLNEQICYNLFSYCNYFNLNIYQYFLKDKDRINQFLQHPFKYFYHNKIDSNISHFQNLLFIKIIKPELTIQAIIQYIKQILGNDLLTNESPTMLKIYQNTSNKIPLIFILSVGIDPLQNMLKLAQEKNKNNQNISIISLGQGQAQPAIKSISQAIKKGNWVILQNCHLGKSFLPQLSKQLQLIKQNNEIHEQFRLFLTSMPCSYFPINILQNSLKITNQTAKGIKTNLKTIIKNIQDNQNEQKMNLYWNICLFHTIIIERKKFGSLGWNIAYDFNTSDLQTSLTIVNNLINTYDQIPWDAIQYFMSQIIYGGRVTDQFDRKLLKTIINDYIIQGNQKFKIKDNSYQNYVDFVNLMSDNDHPMLFGMHDIAEQIYQLKQKKQFINSAMLLEPQEINITDNIKILNMIEEFIKNIPAIIKRNDDNKNIDAITICLTQEIVRFNQLIGIIDRSLKELFKAIKGQINMNQQLQEIYFSITINKVPKLWSNKSYVSLKPLLSWFKDFIDRIKFFKQSIYNKPQIYWISAFFFPQGFLTSILQIYARKTKIPVDNLNFTFVFKSFYEKEINDNNTIITDGCLINGLYSQACLVDLKTSMLKQNGINVMDNNQVPIIHFKPQIIRNENNMNYNICQIPLYKTKTRAGILSTTGHSTNYIISIICKSQQMQSFWIKRGAAFFCSLDK